MHQPRFSQRAKSDWGPHSEPVLSHGYYDRLNRAKSDWDFRGDAVPRHSSYDRRSTAPLNRGYMPVNEGKRFGPSSEELGLVGDGDDTVKLEEGRAHGSGCDCARHCCARLFCSWFFKGAILLVVTKLIFLCGPLSKPWWIPISFDRACEKNNDPLGSVRSNLKQIKDHTLDMCQTACERTAGCTAIDVFNKTNVCNLYDIPCTYPTADWDGASSFQMVEYCTLPNGSGGILIQGHCDSRVEPPTFWSLVRQEFVGMCTSPSSWCLSLFVAFVYSYVTSDWLRDKLENGCLGFCFKCLSGAPGQTLALFFCWVGISAWYFDWPFPSPEVHWVAVETLGCSVPAWAPMQWVLNLAAVLLLCLIWFTCFRTYFLSNVLAPLIVLVLAWAVVSHWYFDWPDLANPLSTPPMRSVPFIAHKIPQWPPMQWTLNGLAVLLLAMIICPCLRQFVTGIVVAVGGIAMALFNSASLLVWGGCGFLTGVEGAAGAAVGATEGVLGVEGVAGAVGAGLAGVESAAATVEGAFGAEAVAVSDAAAGVIATVESVTAAEAATAAVAAEAAAGAGFEGVGAIVLMDTLCIVQ